MVLGKPFILVTGNFIRTKQLLQILTITYHKDTADLNKTEERANITESSYSYRGTVLVLPPGR
jgi:hypothetical protein